MEIEPPLASWIREKKKDIESIRWAENPSVITHIVIHHSLTKDGPVKDWDAIRRYHMETNGWNSIGYHCGLERIKDDYQVMLGRPLDKRGAHVKDGGFNNKSIGICVVGNWDRESPPEKQWILTRLLVENLRTLYTSKGMLIPKENVIGHWEAQAQAGLAPNLRKSCPGRLFDLNKFRSELV
jgi:hypothetical protein